MQPCEDLGLNPAGTDSKKIEFSLDRTFSDELEFGTFGKLMAIGCEDGKVFVICVQSRQILATHFLPTPIASLCWLPSSHLVLGLEDGQLLTIDAKVSLRIQFITVQILYYTHASLSKAIFHTTNPSMCQSLLPGNSLHTLRYPRPIHSSMSNFYSLSPHHKHFIPPL